MIGRAVQDTRPAKRLPIAQEAEVWEPRGVTRALIALSCSIAILGLTYLVASLLGALVGGH